MNSNNSIGNSPRARVTLARKIQHCKYHQISDTPDTSYLSNLLNVTNAHKHTSGRRFSPATQNSEIVPMYTIVLVLTIKVVLLSFILRLVILSLNNYNVCCIVLLLVPLFWCCSLLSAVCCLTHPPSLVISQSHITLGPWT